MRKYSFSLILNNDPNYEYTKKKTLYFANYNKSSNRLFNKVRPTNTQWARVVGYGPFFLCIIHKEGLCPSSGNIYADDEIKNT
jgi:hypothetical protein